MDFIKTTGVLNEVLSERERQEKLHGVDPKHTPETWLMILGEEVGEVNKAALETRFGVEGASWEQYRHELVQVAAVAVAMIESFDRQYQAAVANEFLGIEAYP